MANSAWDCETYSEYDRCAFVSEKGPCTEFFVNGEERKARIWCQVHSLETFVLSAIKKRANGKKNARETSEFNADIGGMQVDLGRLDAGGWQCSNSDRHVLQAPALDKHLRCFICIIWLFVHL